MVDLDSDPTKLIEVVEIGKELLMTRGALTTFSIANDVAKYFAIIPAMFLGFYPQLQALNIMRLASPESAILSAIIFNALIIVALNPARAQRRRLPADRRRGAAASQSARLRPWRSPGPLHRDQDDRPHRDRHRSRLKVNAMNEIRPAIAMTVLMTILTGLVYPLVMTGLAEIAFPVSGARQPDRARAGSSSAPT